MANQTPTDAWWRKPRRSRDLAGAIWAKVDAIRTRRREDNLDDLLNEAIYLGRALGRNSGGRMAREQRTAPYTTINIVQAKVDALCARMSKHRPFPIIGAEDSTYTEKRFAKRISTVLRAKLGAQEIERDNMLRVRDACVRGTGVAKVVCVERGGKMDVGVERVPRSEVIVGSRDAMYGRPRCVYHIRSYPLEVLCARYPAKVHDKLAALATTNSYDSDEWYLWGDDWADDSLTVKLIEAWHLRSGCDADDGRRVLVGQDLVLEDEEYERPRHPFALLHYSPPMQGWYGQGLVQMLSGPQAKINDITRDMQEALYWASGVKIFGSKGSFPKEFMSKRHPIYVETNGPAPTLQAPLPISGQAFQLVEFLMNWCDDISGLSRDFQSGRTQLGAGASGAAIDALDDITSDRLAGFQLHHSLSQVDLGALIIDQAHEIAEEYSRGEQAPWIAEHRWEDVDLDGGRHHLRLEPENFLPGTRAGRLAAATELFKSGLIDAPGMTALFSEPDIQSANRTILGPQNAIGRVMEDIFDPKVPLYTIVPDSFFPFDLGIKTAVAEYCDAWADGASQDLLGRCRRWIELARHAQTEAAKALQPPPGSMAPAGAAPPGAPPGMPPGAPPADPSMPMQLVA